MWKGNKISVVFSTYNEKNSIKQCINAFFDTGIVDEVIAVDNNAAKGTKEEILKTNAKYFLEKNQGFGYGYQRALKEATGEIIVMTEPDATFAPNDILKLLAYCDDFDVVFGTRTTSIMIGEGANMGKFIKWGNFAVAKLVEILFNTPQLTDVGCTYKLIKREVYEKIKEDFRIRGNEFNIELMLLIIKKKVKFIEVPINYLKRVGESSVTGKKWKAFKVGLKMIGIIFKYRFNIIKR